MRYAANIWINCHEDCLMSYIGDKEYVTYRIIIVENSSKDIIREVKKFFREIRFVTTTDSDENVKVMEEIVRELLANLETTLISEVDLCGYHIYLCDDVIIYGDNTQEF